MDQHKIMTEQDLIDYQACHGESPEGVDEGRQSSTRPQFEHVLEVLAALYDAYASAKNYDIELENLMMAYDRYLD